MSDTQAPTPNWRALREASGLSRDELAQLAGVTYNVISSLESGNTPRGGDDTKALVEQALQLALSKRGAPSGDADNVTIYTRRDQLPRRRRGGEIPTNGYTFEYEFEGLEPGDLCIVTNEEGSFRFIELTTSPSGSTSVSVYGGRAGYEKLRSFRPERVVKV